MGSFYMEATQINYRRDEALKTVDQKLQELSETSAIDTDIAPVFKSTNTYAPGDMVYYRNKLYVFNVEHTGAWAAADVTATDVTTQMSSLKSGLTNVNTALDVPAGTGKNLAFKMISKATINENGVIETNNAYNLFVAKVSNGETYTATKGNDYRLYAFYSANPTLGSTSYDGSRVVESNTASSFTFTAPTNGFIAFRSLVAFTDGQCEKGSTATAYTPYIPSVNDRTSWVGISAVDLTTDTSESIDTTGFTELLIYYGKKNGAQVYQGGSLLLINGTNKPCTMPVYDNDTLAGTCYIAIDSSHTLTVRNRSVTSTMRFVVYGRA